MTQNTLVIASVNGVRLAEPDELLGPDVLRERAYTELLRQRAVELGFLAADSRNSYQDPDNQTRDIIEQMLDTEVTTPEPGPDEQRRYYEANSHRYVINQKLRVRHILFAAVPGINVQALANKAEEVLLTLSGKNIQSDVFARAAKAYSNCPTGENGGELGWIGPQDCAPELSQAFFMDSAGVMPVGLHPRLLHSRFGLHIVEVLQRDPGRQLAFEEVQDRVAMTLLIQSRSTAWRQYMMILAGQADIRGVDIEGADSPLVQG